MQLDKNYFIDKFKAIPDEQWCTMKLDNGLGAKCALGHCGVHSVGKTLMHTQESMALTKLLGNGKETKMNVVYDINDGLLDEYIDPYQRPKQRILEKLKALPNV